MKKIFHPGQLFFGEADPEAVGSMKKEVKRRLTQGTGESAGSSTSSSRRSRERVPAANFVFPFPGRRKGEAESEESSTETHIVGNIKCAAAGDEHTQPAGRDRQVP